jgi:NAD(P)-dependent dehydrogenase (short-subunit alcohol dehydrogenase family)
MPKKAACANDHRVAGIARGIRLSGASRSYRIDTRIGLGIALRLCEAGASVMCNARTTDTRQRSTRHARVGAPGLSCRPTYRPPRARRTLVAATLAAFGRARHRRQQRRHPAVRALVRCATARTSTP